MANRVFRAWTRIVRALNLVSGAWPGNRILKPSLRFDSFIERGSGLFFSCAAKYAFFERGSVDVTRVVWMRHPAATGVHRSRSMKNIVSPAWCAAVPGLDAFFGGMNRISSVVDAARIVDISARTGIAITRNTLDGSFFERGLAAGWEQSRISSEVLQCNKAKTIVFRARGGGPNAVFMHF